MKTVADKVMRGQVHCPICTHSVDADVDMNTKKPRVAPGQKCPRCSASLDAAFVLQVQEAA